MDWRLTLVCFLASVGIWSLLVVFLEAVVAWGLEQE